MTPFLLETSVPVYHVRIWDSHIACSLAVINRSLGVASGVIVDIAGGAGPLSQHVNRLDFDYIVIDKNRTALTSSHSDHHRVVAAVPCLPLKSGSVDLAITITCLQYLEHQAFFAECRRMLAHGGMLAIHENGKYNPFILIARFAQRCVGLIRWDVWKYRNTILQYVDPGFSPEGFEVVYSSSTGVLTPLLFCVEQLGIPYSDAVLRCFERMDRVLLQFPIFRKLSFLHIVHYGKIS